MIADFRVNATRFISSKIILFGLEIYDLFAGV
jgi:hypothetical protein